MEYTRLVTFLEALGYELPAICPSKEPLDWLTIIVNIDEDDVIEIETKANFNKNGIGYEDVRRQEKETNAFLRSSRSSLRAFLWEKWR